MERKERRMHIVRSKRLPVMLAAVVVAGVFAAVAISAVVSQQTIADTGNVHLRVVRTVVDGFGFDSGWHVHPGVAIVQVQDGTFQIYQGSCTPTTVGPGQTFIE